MLDKDLKDYLDKVKTLPQLPPEVEIRQALRAAGWNDQEIEESIIYLKPAPSSAIPPRPIAPSVTPPITQTPVTPSASFQAAPQTSPYAASSPVQPQSSFTPSQSFKPQLPIEPKPAEPASFRPQPIAPAYSPVASSPSSVQSSGTPVGVPKDFGVQKLTAFRGPGTISPESQYAPRPPATAGPVSPVIPKMSTVPAPLQQPTATTSLQQEVSDIASSMTPQSLPRSSSLGKWLMIFLVVIILAAGGVFGYAYFAKVWFFASMSEQEQNDLLNPPVTTQQPVQKQGSEVTGNLTSKAPTAEDILGNQIENITALHDALVNYYNLIGAYPDSLADLTKTAPELLETKAVAKGFISSEYVKKAFSEDPLLNIVPKDEFTKAEYLYVHTATDYKLTYVVNLPKYEDVVFVSDYFTEDSAGARPKIWVKYVAGANTATSKMISEEAMTDSKIDADLDGVPDSFETWAGLDKTKKDSNDDGTSDLEEVLSQ
jgi:hypothetical protein